MKRLGILALNIYMLNGRRMNTMEFNIGDVFELNGQEFKVIGINKRKMERTGCYIV